MWTTTGKLAKVVIDVPPTCTRQLSKLCPPLYFLLAPSILSLPSSLHLSTHQNRLLDGLQEVLEASDYVCGILPSTPQTRGLLNGDVLKSCAKKVSEAESCHVATYINFIIPYFRR